MYYIQTNAWFPPFRCRGFRRSVLERFRCAVVTFRFTLAVLPFRSYRCRYG